MADGIIKHSDFAEEGAISEHFSKEALELIDILNSQLEPALKKAALNAKAFYTSFKFEGATVENIKELNAVLAQTNEIEAIHTKAQKAKIELNAKQQAQAQIDKANKKDDIALLKATIVEMDKAVGTLQKLEAANTRLRLERKKLNLDTAEGRARLKEINAELDKNNAYIKENSDQLKRQKLNVGNYTESIKNAAAGVLKWASALGVVISAKEVFNKAINASQVLSDNFAATMKGLSESTDYFFRVLATGDWSNFLTGLRESYAEGRRYAEAIDLLGDKQRALNVTTADIELEITRLKGIAKLKSNEISVRKDAVDKIIELEKKKLVATKGVKDEELSNELKNAAHITKLTEDEIKTLLSSIDTQDKLSEARNKYNEIVGKSQENLILPGGASQRVLSQEKLNALIKQEPKEIQDAINAELKLALVTDEKRKIITDAIVSSTNANKEYEEGLNSLAKLRNSLEKELIGEDKKGEDAVKKQDEVLKRIAELKKKYEDDLLKQQAQTNVEKVLADKKIAIAEVDAIKAGEEKKAALRMALEKYYSQRLSEAVLKDNEILQNKIDEANKKKADEDQKKLDDQIAAMKEHLKHLDALAKEEADRFKMMEEAKKKAAEERAKQIKQIEEDTTDGIAEGLQKRADLQQAAADKEISLREKLLETQMALAAEGKENTLAEEQARLEKAEERRIQAQKRAQKEQEILTLVKTFSDTLQQALNSDKPFFKALGEALGATGAVKAAFASLVSGSFIEGTENVADDLSGNKVHNGKDGYVIAVDGRERILNPQHNEMLGGISNAQLVSDALAYRDVYNSANIVPVIAKEKNDTAIMTAAVINRLESIERAITDKPIERTNLGKLGEWTQEIEERGMKKVIHHKQTRRSLRING